MNIRVLRFFAAFNLIVGVSAGVIAVIAAAVTWIAEGAAPLDLLYVLLVSLSGVLSWALLSTFADVAEAIVQRCR